MRFSWHDEIPSFSESIKLLSYHVSLCVVSVENVNLSTFPL